MLLFLPCLSTASMENSRLVLCHCSIDLFSLGVAFGCYVRNICNPWFLWLKKPNLINSVLLLIVGFRNPPLPFKLLNFGMTWVKVNQSGWKWKQRALSIQPKIPEISVGTSYGTNHFSLVRLEYSGPALKVVHFDLSGHFRWSNQNFPFHLTKLMSPPVWLFCILLTRTITIRVLA